MALDLSKIKALELPKKEVTVEVMGESQNITIAAYGDDVSLKITDIMRNYPADGELRIRELLLVECAGLTEEDARLFLQRDGKGAASVLREIFTLVDEFDEERAKYREEIKKKSTPE